MASVVLSMRKNKYSMKNKFTKIKYLFFGFFLSLFLISSCKNNNTTKVEKAFYYWKSNDGSFYDDEYSALKNLKIQKLYVKFFEVVPDEVFKNKPIAKLGLRLNQSYLKYRYNEDPELEQTINNLEIIPTVFVKNSVLEDISKSRLDTLADNIVFLCKKYYKRNLQRKEEDFNEIQIDCDWTASTSEKYFYLLKSIKDYSKKEISCTLRLYPYKFPDKMGIPPVSKVTLMCYNLINPLANENKNSIQNNQELEKYLKGAKEYPIHTDIALPIFSWIQVYQHNKFVALINPKYIYLENISKQIKPLWYEVQEDKELNNMYLRAGDKLKIEDVTKKETDKTISLLKKYVNFGETTTITFFHLDNKNVKKYSNETFNRFFSDFSK